MFGLPPRFPKYLSNKTSGFLAVELLLLPHALERLAVGFAVHEAAGTGIAFGP
jgi:hypothetical protein